VSAADWGAEWLKKHVPSKTLTFDVLLIAKPKSTGMGASHKAGAAFLKRVMIPVHLPRLAMLCGRKERAFKKDQTIACNVQLYNPLPYPITNAVMSFSISGQGSESMAQSVQTTQKAIGPSPQAQAQQSAPAQQAGSSAAVGAGNTLNTPIQEADPNSREIFKDRFHLNGAVGTQIIIAKLTSNELDGVSGVMEITIN